MNETASEKVDKVLKELRKVKRELVILKSEMTVDSPFMTKREVMLYFRFTTVRMIDNWIKKGLLVPMRSHENSRCLFRKEEVMQFSETYFLRQ